MHYRATVFETLVPMRHGVYRGGGGAIDYSDTSVSQEGRSTFRKGEGDKRQHCPELDRRQKKRVRLAVP